MAISPELFFVEGRCRGFEEEEGGSRDGGAGEAALVSPAGLPCGGGPGEEWGAGVGGCCHYGIWFGGWMDLAWIDGWMLWML